MSTTAQVTCPACDEELRVPVLIHIGHCLSDRVVPVTAELAPAAHTAIQDHVRGHIQSLRNPAAPENL